MRGIRDNGRSNYRTDSALRYAPVTKDNANPLPDGVCRALWVGTAGTANLVEEDGTERANFPLKEGLNSIIVKQVKTGGTADDIWALY